MIHGRGQSAEWDEVIAGRITSPSTTDGADRCGWCSVLAVFWREIAWELTVLLAFEPWRGRQKQFQCQVDQTLQLQEPVLDILRN
jgi:hypothetical protein